VTPDYFNGHLRRALQAVQSQSTEMAPSVLRVPMSYYRPGAHADRERAQVWEWAPLPLVFSCELRQPNDYVVREVLGKSVLVVRGDDGVVRAFENYCRHRGGRPASGCGNRRRFICPYHAWTYDTQGRLAAIPAAEGFPDVDRATNGLVALPCEERHGLVWLKLSPDDSIDLRTFLGDTLDDELGRWPYAQASIATDTTAIVDADWKMVVENFAETYHFATVHGKSIPGQMLMSNTVTHDALGLHHRLCFAMKTIGTLAQIEEKDWNWRDHLVVVYWIFPGLVAVNVRDALQVNIVLPAGEGRTSVRTLGLSLKSGGSAEEEAQLQYIHDSSAQAVLEEDVPIMNTFGGMVAASSQTELLVGRNEIGVQHAIRTIAGRIGFAL
jgi:choline monooxygenase